MPNEVMVMKMADSDLTVSQYIDSRPRENRQYLIAAALQCLRRRVKLNEAELQIGARTIRYSR